MEYSFWNNDVDRYLVIQMAERCHDFIVTRGRHQWSKEKVLELKEKYPGILFNDKHFNKQIKSNRFCGALQQWKIIQQKGEVNDNNFNTGRPQQNATRTFKKMLVLWMQNRSKNSTTTLYEDMEYVYQWAIKMNWIGADKWNLQKLWELYNTLCLNKKEIMWLEELLYDDTELQDELYRLYSASSAEERLEFNVRVALLYSEFLKCGQIRSSVSIWEFEKEITGFFVNYPSDMDLF